jgi:CubicO group peptidase (beta-lactamase class C family)
LRGNPGAVRSGSNGSTRRPPMADGLTAAGLKRLREAAEQHVGDDRVPGLVALVASGDQVHVETLGRLTIGGAAVAEDSIFRISSTTKPITAAATLALAAEGLITLDDPVDRLLPELSGRRVLRRMDGPLDDTVPATRHSATERPASSPPPAICWRSRGCCFAAALPRCRPAPSAP